MILAGFFIAYFLIGFGCAVWIRSSEGSCRVRHVMWEMWALVLFFVIWPYAVYEEIKWRQLKPERTGL